MRLFRNLSQHGVQQDTSSSQSEQATSNKSPPYLHVVLTLVANVAADMIDWVENINKLVVLQRQ